MTYAFTDKLTGHTRTFAASEEEMVVRFAPSVAGDRVDELLADDGLQIGAGANLAQGYAAIRTAGGGSLSISRLDAESAIAASFPAVVDAEGNTRYFLPDELTVRFNADVPAETAEATIAGVGFQIRERHRTPGYYTVSLSEGRELFEAITVFVEMDAVKFAEPSEAAFDSALLVPADPRFAEQWALCNTGQVVEGVAGTPGADVKAVDAWELTQGSDAVVVVVIDTGVDVDHPDLADRLEPRGDEDWDFADGQDGVPEDLDGHGTHVAGIACAGLNGQGIVGVAPGARLIALRIDVKSGMNQNRADAINYVAQAARGAPAKRFVINCSWHSNGDHLGIRDAIQTAAAAGVLVVAAAGNRDVNIDAVPVYPAVYPEVMAVAATDSRDRRWSRSNFGHGVAVSAPGVDILSTYVAGGFNLSTGTSMAAPHVAGVAALVWSARPGLASADVRRALEEGCDDISEMNSGHQGMLGRGRINAAGALRAAGVPGS